MAQCENLAENPFTEISFQTFADSVIQAAIDCQADLDACKSSAPIETTVSSTDSPTTLADSTTQGFTQSKCS